LYIYRAFLHNIVSDYEIEQLEIDFNKFTIRHFDEPSECRNIEQVQFYIQGLSIKIEEFKSRFKFVPDNAYVLLNEYNASQSKLVFRKFRQTNDQDLWKT